MGYGNHPFCCISVMCLEGGKGGGEGGGEGSGVGRTGGFCYTCWQQGVESNGQSICSYLRGGNKNKVRGRREGGRGGAEG